MNFTTPRSDHRAAKLASLLGTASLLTMANAVAAQAQQVAQAQTAQAEEVPENVLITGSLIRGAVAVGVPVTNLNVQDFRTTGAQTVADLFRTVPVANVSPGPVGTNSGGHQERETRVNIRGLDQTGPRSLLMVDGIRFPPQADGICAIDPSIIPSLALDRIDILADGASATYGSDAIAGVINIILKRNFDGAVTQLHTQFPDVGGIQYQASQLWGRTWDGGDIALTYEWSDEGPVPGNAHSKYTGNYSPWGLDDRTPIGSSTPGTISTGAPSSTLGTTCANCFAIPHGTGGNFNVGASGVGPLLPGSAATLNWGPFSANSAYNTTNGTRNVTDPFHNGVGYEVAGQQTNRAVITIDQRLTKDITFYGSAFYSNRRVNQIVAEGANQVTNDILTVGVPTFNPYYPNGAPNGLRVSYDIAHEIPPYLPAYEVSDRYQFGLNIALPYSWSAKVYDSRSYDSNHYQHNGVVNRNAVSAALGWTVAGTAAVGTTPAIATYTKPANIPYLNLFCDFTQYQCNSPATLKYVTGFRYLDDTYSIEEKGATFDGPLFDLPAGSVKAAIGGTYDSDSVLFHRGTNIGNPSLILVPTQDSEPYNVWAGFAQVNIPIFGGDFSFPLLRKFDLEASWRHDQYHGTILGATSNPKLGFTWQLSEDIGATIRGGWGTSFRFANAGEYSVVASDAVNDYGLPTSANSPLNIQCGPSGTPTAGSLARKLFDNVPGFGCGSAPPGLSQAGGPQVALRNYVNPVTGLPTLREGGVNLAPEKSTNYSLGFEIAPTTFLKGLDVQATWYQVKINGTLLGFNNPTSSTLGTPTEAFHYVTPGDLAGCTAAMDAHPSLCAPFEAMALEILQDPGSTPGVGQLTNVYWINDGGTVGAGFVKVEGIDWSASYDFDAGSFGAWNTGIVGTYYLHRFSQTVTGGTIIDEFHQNLTAIGGIPQNGVETLPRMQYRARLGWSDGGYSVTGFMNYVSHYYHTQTAPPNVNNQCTAPQSNVGGGTFPCLIYGYSNIQPSWYTFDLSFGYDTGDTPANEYLRNIGIQLVIQNIAGIHPAFQYGPSNNGRTIAAYDILKQDTGRVWNISITKTW